MTLGRGESTPTHTPRAENDLTPPTTGPEGKQRTLGATMQRIADTSRGSYPRLTSCTSVCRWRSCVRVCVAAPSAAAASLAPARRPAPSLDTHVDTHPDSWRRHRGLVISASTLVPLPLRTHSSGGGDGPESQLLTGLDSYIPERSLVVRYYQK